MQNCWVSWGKEWVEGKEGRKGSIYPLLWEPITKYPGAALCPCWQCRDRGTGPGSAISAKLAQFGPRETVTNPWGLVWARDHSLWIVLIQPPVPEGEGIWQCGCGQPPLLLQNHRGKGKERTFAPTPTNPTSLPLWRAGDGGKKWLKLCFIPPAKAWEWKCTDGSGEMQLLMLLGLKCCCYLFPKISFLEVCGSLPRRNPILEGGGEGLPFKMWFPRKVMRRGAGAIGPVWLCGDLCAEGAWGHWTSSQRFCKLQEMRVRMVYAMSTCLWGREIKN